MAETVGRILKSEEVKFEGRIQLNAARPQSSTRLGRAAQARIVENHPEFAIIEITCCCGARTYLRCQYAGEVRQKIKD